MIELVLNNYLLTVSWEDIPSVSQLATLCETSAIQVELESYGGIELVGSLNHTLESDDHYLTATSGDILLYRSSSIVLMNGTNRWDYTLLGKVAEQDMAILEQALQAGRAQLEIRCNDVQ